MMGREKTKERLVINIGIALTAGMFSIMPVAYGAPSGGEFKTSAGGTITTVGTDMNIAGKATNNVITWNDFSVKSGETVKFDGGERINNYLNIVTGQNTSQINGTIKGGNDVYIVNPNGVIMGKGATVDVGNFYASTRYIDPAAAKAAADNGDMSAVLANTSNTVAADVVNLGSINADKVVVEGQNVRFLDSNSVTSSGVTTKANGYIHIGNSTGGDAGYTGKTLSGSANAPVYYKLINSMSAVTGSGNYMLSGNILGGSGFAGTFSGDFDGMGYTITGMAASKGLFAQTNNARIYNLGIVNSTIKDTAGDYAGAVVGKATNTLLENVYNSGSGVSAGDAYVGGGLIGIADGVTINNCWFVV